MTQRQEIIRKGKSPTYLCPVLDIGLPVQQQADHLCPALEAGQGQGCVAVGLDLGVNVRAHIKQQLHGRDVAIHSSQHQRRNPQLAASPGGKKQIAVPTAEEKLWEI